MPPSPHLFKHHFQNLDWIQGQLLAEQHAVTILQWEEARGVLTARVQEVSRQTWHEVRFDQVLTVHGTCTCQRRACPHMAAAIFALTLTPKVKPEPVLTIQEQSLVTRLTTRWEAEKDVDSSNWLQLRALYEQKQAQVRKLIPDPIFQNLKAFLTGPLDGPPPLPRRLQAFFTPVKNRVFFTVHVHPKPGNVRLVRLVPVVGRQEGTTLNIVDEATLSGPEQELKTLMEKQHPWATLDSTPTTSPLILRLLEQGRLYLPDQLDCPFTLGEPRKAHPQWWLDPEGNQHPRLHLEGDLLVLPFSPPLYLDLKQRQIGRIDLPWSLEDTELFLRAPVVPPEHTGAFQQALRTSKPHLPHLQVLEVHRGNVSCVPHLTLTADPGKAGGTEDTWKQRYGELKFMYGDTPIEPGDRQELVRLVQGSFVRQVPRNTDQEDTALRLLENLGLERETLRHQNFSPFSGGKAILSPGKRWFLKSTHLQPASWPDFLVRQVPKLRSLGWQVDVTEHFPVKPLRQTGWTGRVHPQGEWFSLDLGVRFGEVTVSLLDVVRELLHQQGHTLRAGIEHLPEGTVTVDLPQGRTVQVDVSRLKPILQVLTRYGGQTGTVRLPRMEASLLLEIQDLIQPQWTGADPVLHLARALQGARSGVPFEVPAGLQADLRPYQQDGVRWLQFLRQNHLGGILADDMGLGKTLQTLSHLLIEKEQGRLKRPALVVAPTSLMHNWEAEAEKFTPQLETLVVQGLRRKTLYQEIPQVDVVFTTYPLLSRDVSELSKHHFHTIVLDEAQHLKNPRTQTSKALQRLSSDHRLALTGTPMENHLGELHSIFQALMPGFLPDEREFNTRFRNPIEKDGQLELQQHLAKQVGPLILRRTKMEVAPELPEKTEVVVRLDLEDTQRDVYEALRIRTFEEVQQQIQERGLAGSQMHILEALLRLRQACCDPALLPDLVGQTVGSVKRIWFEETVPEMLEEGRSILVFSQFTSLLSLLETSLQEKGMDYALLTGNTRDRPREIERFQSGEVKIFLVSLKAGGVGLNLTAADTVIHFDPWWNPAAENQATDRAYRIGQDKPVFVYKLITRGTVEEKILKLQARKAELAAGMLEEALGSGGKLPWEDLSDLWGMDDPK